MVPSPEIREEFVPVPGGHLWATTQGRGLPLVLCHGGPGLSDNLGPLAHLVEHRATVHRFDQRGAPRSTAAAPFDVATAIADLERLRRFWGYERWVVGGHSWGANLALLYALAHPLRTAGVVYVSGLGSRWGWQAQTRRHRVGRLTDAERAELEALETLVADGDTTARPRMQHLLWSTDVASRAVADRVLSAGPLYAFPRNEVAAQKLNRSHREVLRADIDAGISRLPVLVFCLTGEEDADPDRSRRVAELAPFGVWAPVAGAGHSPWLERADLVQTALAAFLERCTHQPAPGVRAP